MLSNNIYCRQLRVDVLTKAVIYNHPQTVRKAKALFDDWMVNKTQLVVTVTSSMTNNL